MNRIALVALVATLLANCAKASTSTHDPPSSNAPTGGDTSTVATSGAGSATSTFPAAASVACAACPHACCYRNGAFACLPGLDAGLQCASHEFGGAVAPDAPGRVGCECPSTGDSHLGGRPAWGTSRDCVAPYVCQTAPGTIGGYHWAHAEWNGCFDLERRCVNGFMK